MGFYSKALPKKTSTHKTTRVKLGTGLKNTHIPSKKKSNVDKTYKSAKLIYSPYQLKAQTVDLYQFYAMGGINEISG